MKVVSRFTREEITYGSPLMCTTSDLDWVLQVLMPSHTFTGCSKKRRVTYGKTHVYISFSIVNPRSNTMKASIESKCFCKIIADELLNPDLPSSPGLRDEGDASLVWLNSGPGWAWRGNKQPGFHFHKKILLPHQVFQKHLPSSRTFMSCTFGQAIGGWVVENGWVGWAVGRCNCCFHFHQCPPSPRLQLPKPTNPPTARGLV